MVARLAVAVFDVLAAKTAMSSIFGAFVPPRQGVLALLTGNLALANLDTQVAVVANSIG
jgi:hypothetical protein